MFQAHQNIQKQHLLEFFFAPRKDILGEIIASLVAEDGLNFFLKKFENCVKIMKKHSKNSDFEYPELGHWYSVTKMVRIYPNFG